MPYQKNYRRPRRRYRRRAPTRGAIYGRAATQLYKDVKTLKNLINVEFKYHDTQFSQQAHTTGAILSLNFVSQGDGATSRDGDQFRMKSLELHGAVALPSAATRPNNTRLMLILDTEPTGALPALTDILDDQSGAINFYYAPRNLDNRTRFIVLKDWHYTVNPNGTEAYQINHYRKLDIKTLFNGATGSITTLKNNHLFLLVAGDEASGANNPTYALSSRIRYVDN